jgi:hypothetical protein
MTTKALRPPAVHAEARTLGILISGYLAREREERQYIWDRNSSVLCPWPLTALGPDDDPTRMR